MAQQQENPIYWDQHSSRFNLTLIFSLVVAVLGLFTAGSGFPFLIILGLGMAAYSWLTTPRQYLLYRDSMVIIYGIPRTRHISFAEISHVELLALPLGERLRIRMISGSRLMLMMRDPGAFRGHLEDALARYHGEQSGAAYVEGAVLTQEREAEYQDLEYQDTRTLSTGTLSTGNRRTTRNRPSRPARRMRPGMPLRQPRKPPPPTCIPRRLSSRPRRLTRSRPAAPMGDTAHREAIPSRPSRTFPGRAARPTAPRWSSIRARRNRAARKKRSRNAPRAPTDPLVFTAGPSAPGSVILRA